MSMRYNFLRHRHPSCSPRTRSRNTQLAGDIAQKLTGTTQYFTLTIENVRRVQPSRYALLVREKRPDNHRNDEIWVMAAKVISGEMSSSPHSHKSSFPLLFLYSSAHCRSIRV